MGRHTRSALKRQSTLAEARNSSIEVLRIFAMLMIVAHHCYAHNAFDFMNQPLSVTKVALQTFVFSGGKIGVVVFFTISAWFLSDSISLKTAFRRVWILEREMLFWSLVLLLVSKVLTLPGLTMMVFVQSIIPTISALWWYPTAYVVFLLFFPFLVKGLRAIGRIWHLAIGLIMLTIWTVLEGFIPITNLGLPGGDFLSFVYIYVLVAYMRWYMPDIRVGVAWLSIIIGYGLIAAASICGNIVSRYMHGAEKVQIYLSTAEFKLPVLMVGFGLFGLFAGAHYTNRAINSMAKSTFAVYLISEYPTVRTLLWTNWFDMGAFYGKLILFPVFFGVVVGVFVACMCCDYIRRGLFFITIDRHPGKWFDALWRTAMASNIVRRMLITNTATGNDLKGERQ